MHIVILGCGRVGSLLAHSLDHAGQSVAIVDRDASAFRKLRPDFRGITVTGIGFDRETLERAGIQRATAFAAVSSGDNSNILAARVARETYGVENVVARIYDPQRAEIYERLGIPTVATVSWTTGQIIRRLTPSGGLEMFRDPSGTIALSEIHIAPQWIGERLSALEETQGVRVAFITRYGIAQLPAADTVIQEGDLIHVLHAPTDRDRIEEVFASAPVVES